MIDAMENITSYLNTEMNVLKYLEIDEIERAVNTLYEAIKNQKTIYCFGNGGSASTASHFSNDFNKILNSKLDKKFNFICLNDNIATLMAIANDINYSEVFHFQLQGRVQPGDIIIAISGSGNSPNVLSAVNYAKAQGATIIALTGYDGGALSTMANINLNAPINNMQITEDVHLMFNHLLVSVLSKILE